MVRGNNKARIFRDADDKAVFIERLGQNALEAGCSVYAWVLLDNHAHVLFQSGWYGISIVMRKLLTGYAQYFNRRHRRTGHLFQNRYKSILCDREAYLLALVRYIHLNPIRANVVQTLDELDSYPWSGHRAIIGKTACPWMSTGAVLSEFAATKRKAITEYRQFLREGIGRKHDRTFSGGGLVRSHGGWSQVLSLRRKKQKEEFDERILGNGDFVHAVLKEAEEKQLRQVRLQRAGETIDGIVDQETGKSQISIKELKSGSRRQRVSETRAKIACRCVEELGMSCAETARHLGVCTSSISRLVAREVRSH
jgi:REP element-mobilizing transposase RayT